MSYAPAQYTGNGTNRVWNVPFPYLEPGDVHVSHDGVDQPYTFAANGQVIVATAAAVGSVVLVYRSTQRSTALFQFQLGSLSPLDLNDNLSQVLFVMDEEIARAQAQENMLLVDITQETAARIAALALEQAARIAGDLANATSIAQETAARQMSDAAISAAVAQVAAGLNAVAGRTTTLEQQVSALLTTTAGPSIVALRNQAYQWASGSGPVNDGTNPVGYSARYWALQAQSYAAGGQGISDGVVTTQKLAPAAVTSDKMAAGAAAGNIGIGGATTSLMAPGTHLASLPNGNFEDGLAGWGQATSGRNSISVSTAAAFVQSGKNTVCLTTNDLNSPSYIASPIVPVAGGETFEAELRHISSVASAASNGLQLIVVWLDGNKAALTQAFVPLSTGGAVFTTKTLSIARISAPANARYAQLLPYVGGVVGSVYLDAVEIVRRPPPVLDVRRLGAVPDGVTDSAAAINAALNAAVALGYLGVDCTGAYAISAAVQIPPATAGFRFGGLTGRCRLTQTTAAQDGVVAGSPAGSNGTREVDLVDITVQAGVAKTGGAGFAIYYTYKTHIKGCTTTGQYNSVIDRGNSFHLIEHNSFSMNVAGQYVVQVEGGSVAGYYTKNDLNQGLVPQAGFFVLGSDPGGISTGYTQGMFFQDNEVANCQFGFYFTGGGKNCTNMFMRDNTADANYQANVALVAAQGELLAHFKITGDWINSSPSGRGLFMSTSGNGAVSDIIVSSAQICNNNLQGVLLQYNVSWVRFLGCQVSGNSCDQSGNGGVNNYNKYDGIYLGPAVKHISVQSCTSAYVQDWQNSQRYGLVLDANSGDYMNICLNDLAGNVTGSLFNGTSASNTSHSVIGLNTMQ